LSNLSKSRLIKKIRLPTFKTASMRDYEEMKAHNVGLEMMKIEALDKERPLSETFIRDLNQTILAGDFYKVSRDGEYRYKIHNRHGYPMIVIPTADRRKYLNTLGICDGITGKEPYNGANATLEQIEPFVDFISMYVERKLTFAMQLVTGERRDISETDEEQQKEPIDPNNVRVNVRANVRVKDNILDIITQIPSVTIPQLAGMLSVTERTVYRNINKLKIDGRIERVGSDKTGYWKVYL